MSLLEQQPEANLYVLGTALAGLTALLYSSTRGGAPSQPVVNQPATPSVNQPATAAVVQPVSVYTLDVNATITQINTVGFTYGLTAFQTLKPTSADTLEARTALLAALKTLFVVKVFKLSGAPPSFTFNNETSLYQGDYTAFLVFIGKCLYELQIKKFIA